MISKIDNFGRVLIPKKIRKKLGINRGTKLNIKNSDKQILIEPIFEENLISDENGILVFNGKIDENIDLIIKKDREERINKFLD